MIDRPSSGHDAPRPLAIRARPRIRLRTFASKFARRFVDGHAECRWQRGQGRCRPDDARPVGLARQSRHDRDQVRLRGATGLAIVADGYYPALQGRQALKIEWTDGSGDPCRAPRCSRATRTWRKRRRRSRCRAISPSSPAPRRRSSPNTNFPISRTPRWSRSTRPSTCAVIRARCGPARSSRP